MKRFLGVALISSLLGCIEWDNDEMLRQRRCAAMPTEAGCGSADSGVLDAGNVDDAGSVDAGDADAGIDAGVTDAGTLDAGTSDAGPDAGVLDAGSWTTVWRNVYGVEAHHLVGYGNEAALVGFSPSAGALILRALDADGPAPSEIATMQTDRPTAAYLRASRLVVGVENRDLFLWSKAGDVFTHLATRTPVPDFVTTAVVIYPQSNGEPAVAAYGDQSGSMGLVSYEAQSAQPSLGTVVVPCDTTVMRPQRILPSPDGGPGVVVGSVTGNCGGVFNFNADAGAGFLARFGSGPGEGFTFPAQPQSAMTLGLVDGTLRLAYQPPALARLDLVTIPASGNIGVAKPILLGELIPVEVVDLPAAEFAVVGHARGSISMTDGGSAFQTRGWDVFIARLNGNRDVIDLMVFGDEGDQTAVGAVWMDQTLVVGGGCSASSASGLCADAGVFWTWVAGVQPR